MAVAIYTSKRNYKEHKMNDIQLERIEILKNVINNIDCDREFEDVKALMNLLKKREEASKKATGVIWQLVPLDSPQRKDKEREEAEVQKYKNIVSELDKQIKQVEIEILLYSNAYELHEVYEEFYKNQKEEEL